MSLRHCCLNLIFNITLLANILSFLLPSKFTFFRLNRIIGVIGAPYLLQCFGNYTPQKNLRTSTYVFPLFNTESLIFKIENIF